ncbi:dynactin subunit [Holotrichia oblita]|uniref:Dynactin subunit n=2 Tax=Holotrichia oblita TaxID=644536 RepID=A0ACB9T431_HOLOL|nr:dynactin subunit [Holotrichia oblita]KAI4461578.1 dynactin subunit [Holotrichia oblita]
MADPKYADLPGIAHDEPDIYETNDLPESDQTSDFYEEESEVIEKTNISPTEAFNKYKDKTLTASKVDFSEKISRNLNTGYTYELVKQGENETVLQKYQRLQCEMSELLEEVKKIQSSKDDKDVNCLVSTQQIEQALKKLADLKLEDSFGADLVSTITDPQGAQIKTISNLMAMNNDKDIAVDDRNSYSNDHENSQSCILGNQDDVLDTCEENVTETSLVVNTQNNIEDYSSQASQSLTSALYDNGNINNSRTPRKRKSEQDTTIEMVKVVIDINSTIGRIVKQRNTNNTTATFCQYLESELYNLPKERSDEFIDQIGSLLEAAQQLSATASMLDSAQLDHIEGRLTALTQKLEAVAENRKQISNDTEGDEKVQELYNIVKANEHVSKILPETVERLTALKALHEKATDFATSLTQIELLQSEISSNVENNKNLLQGVQESFANNLNEINKTVMSLDRRIKEIKKH